MQNKMQAPNFYPSMPRHACQDPPAPPIAQGGAGACLSPEAKAR